jgi:flagellar operon protein
MTDRVPLNVAELRAANAGRLSIQSSPRAASGAAGAGRTVSGAAGSGFAAVFEKAAAAQSTLKISKHAEMRLQTRNINLTDAQKEKIAAALQKAEEKGVRDPLVMLDGVALVANVKSRTVITAVDSGALGQGIITNIDGAVFA